MITVLPIKDKAELCEFYKSKSEPLSDDSAAIIARDGENLIGFCLYSMNKKGLTLLRVSPENDLSLADGIIRSALFAAVHAGITDAYYTDTIPVSLLKQLDFIANADKKELKIEKLFGGCKCCGK